MAKALISKVAKKSRSNLGVVQIEVAKMLRSNLVDVDCLEPGVERYAFPDDQLRR